METQAWILLIALTTLAICEGWSIQVNKDPNRRQEAVLQWNKNKREYQTGSNHQPSQSPSPVNYYQNSGVYDLKPPGSPWSNQFYPPSNHWYPQQNQWYSPTNQWNSPSNQWNPPGNQIPTSNNQFYTSGNQISAPNYQNYPINQFNPSNSHLANSQHEPNLATLLAKCSERNLYYCKELLAKQLVQHVREMVTYRTGLDPNILSAILGKFPSRTPFTSEIRSETDLLDNEIPTGETSNYQTFGKPQFYEPHTQWNPTASYASGSNTRPIMMVTQWTDFPYFRPLQTASGYHPNPKPHFKVPQDGFRPSGGYDTSLPFAPPASQEGFRESKQVPLASDQQSKVCNPCIPSPQNQIDIRKKPDGAVDSNSTISTSRA